MKLTLPTILLSTAILILAGALFFTQTDIANGNGYIGFPAHIQSATTTVVGPQSKITLFADVPDCKSRVVTTLGQPIRISFDDATGFGSTTIGSNVGHLQAASTTVAYESGIYGCGRFTAWAPASSTITISNF